MSLGVNNIPHIHKNEHFGSLYPTHKKEKTVDSGLSRGQRTGVAVSSALGVSAALAILAKTATWKRFSLNPLKIINTKIKDTYLYQVKFEEKEIISMTAGSIVGGLAGGLVIDERSNNDKAELKSKVGEAIIQFGNACVPILTIGQCSKLGDKAESGILKKMSPDAGNFMKFLAKMPKLFFILTGLAVGMIIGNKAANYLKKHLLDSDDARKIKPADMFMHWDDLCVAASFFSDGPVVQGFARLVPLAMLMAGYQVGCKGLDHKYINHKVKQQPENNNKETGVPAPVNTTVDSVNTETQETRDKKEE